MEPVAPGTEDEVIDFNSLRKKENENERLLQQKAVLKNGHYENIFELTYVNGAEHWFCKVCECPIMGRVYQHELGRRHSSNLQVTNKHLDKDKNDGGEDEEPISVEVAPGEPVPPGFEGEVVREAQIQERLDGFKVGPLVALEYLLEMLDYDPTKEPQYLCILCDKKGDPRTVLTHLASYNHISQYLQKHFPACYRALAPYMTKQYKRNWQIVLQKIAEAIEKKYGRLKPFCIDAGKFEKDRMHYLTMVTKGQHFSEQMGHNFVELVVHDELTKSYDEEGKPLANPTAWGGKTFIEKPFQKRSPSPPVVARPTKKPRVPGDNNKREESDKKFFDRPSKRPGYRGPRKSSLSSVSSISSDEELSKGPRRPKNRSPPGRNRSPPHRNRSPPSYRGGRRRSPSPRRPYGDHKRVSREEEEQRQRNREKERMEKFEEFKKLSKAIENDMEKTLKNHEKNPEKHPQYNEEWKLFWNRRYKELQLEGKDPAKHDYKPEWIDFWGKRMLELHNEELKNRKEGLRKRLGLPEEINPIRFHIGGAGGGGTTAKPAAKPPVTNDIKPERKPVIKPVLDPEIIIIDDRHDRKPKFDRNSKNRSHSPWEEESPPPKQIPVAKERRISPAKRRDSPERARPLERKRSSPERRKSSPDRRKLSPDRRRPSPERRMPLRDERPPMGKSRDRSIDSKKSLERGRRSRSRDLSLGKSDPRALRRSPGFGRDRERRSRSPIDMFREGMRYSKERELRGGYPGERGWERERMERERYRGERETSFERDLRGRERIRTVADLPWEREKMMYGPGGSGGYDDFYGPPPGMREMPRKPVFIPPPAIEEEEDGEVNVVSVLRLLTALEDKLGSLGPKIIDLLAQALALEKKEANSSETLLDNEINCVMFETVKEKLKGQLLAGLVDMYQERAFKKAIQKTANLIHIASQRRRQREALKPEKEALSVPGVGAVDKAAIARQLANALIAQGKTDVTQAQLEQLINAVVGMAEASKAAGKPINTASFLSKLTGGGGEITAAKSKSPEPPKEKIIIPRIKSSISEEKPDEKLEKPKEKGEIIDLDKLTEPLSPGTPEKATPRDMDNLSDSDLQALLQNFKDLSTEEQLDLINYLKKLELNEPERVERLRKFVNLGPTEKSKQEVIDLEKEENKTSRNGRESPFSNRYDDNRNPDGDEFDSKQDDKPEKIHVDSEEEDYSFDDVVKAASKNVKEKELETRKEPQVDPKTLISNLMSSLSSSISSASSVNLLGLPTMSSISSGVTIPTSSADFAKTLSSINLDNVASILSSVQNLTQNSQQPKLNFEPAKTIVIDPPDNMDFKPASPPKLNFEPPLVGDVRPNPLQLPVPTTIIPTANLLARAAAPGLLGPRPTQLMPVGPRAPLIRSNSAPFPPRGPGPVLNLLSRMGNPNAVPQMGMQGLPRPGLNPGFPNPRMGGPRGPNPNFGRW